MAFAEYPAVFIGAVFLLSLVVLALNIWVTIRGVRRVKAEDRVGSAITGIVLTWVISPIGWIPGFFLTSEN